MEGTMGTRFRWLAAVVAAVTFMPASADADTVRVRSSTDALKMTRTTTALITDAARRTFPGGPCAGRTTWIFNATQRDLADAPEADGLAWVDSCTLAVAPFGEFRDVCVVTLHELGHLAGFEHSDDPRDVMYGGFWGEPQVPACDRAERIYDRVQARREAASAGQKGGPA